MKKHVNMHMILCMLGVGLAKTTYAPVQLGYDLTTDAGVQRTGQSEKLKNQQKNDIADLKKQQEHENRLLKDINKSSKAGNKARTEVAEISGIQLDPKSPTFKSEVERTKYIFKRVHDKEANELAKQHDMQNAHEEAIFEFNTANRASMARIHAQEAEKQAQDEILAQKRASQKSRISVRKNNNKEKRRTYKSRHSAQAEEKDAAKAARKREIAAKKEAKKNARPGKTGVKKEALPRLTSQQKIVDSATAITSSIDALDLLKDDEIKNIQVKLAEAQQAIDSGIFSKIVAAIDVVITLLVKTIKKLNTAKGQNNGATIKQIVDLENQFNEFKKSAPLRK